MLGAVRAGRREGRVILSSLLGQNKGQLRCRYNSEDQICLSTGQMAQRGILSSFGQLGGGRVCKGG